MKFHLILGAAFILCTGCSPSAQEMKPQAAPLAQERGATHDGWALPAPPHSTKLVYPAGETGFFSSTLTASAAAVNLRTDYDAVGDGQEDESQILQTALDDVSASGGGRIYIPKGTYVLSGITVPSNTHIEIEAGTVIRPVRVAYKNANKRKAANKKKKLREASIMIFDLGKRSEKIENVSISGKNGSFSVELHDYEPGIVVFGLGNVQNFQIANVSVKDALTKFSAITMGPGGSKSGERGLPTNGYVTNFTQIGSHYGYGIVQTQAAKNVFFENLHGVGGAVLRMETGVKGMNDDQFGGISNLIGKNISCKDGNAAVMISPHAMHNGVVAVDGIRSEGCGFAVRVGNGYVAKKYTNPNLEAGTFAAGTTVSNVHAVFGENAQLKRKHFKFMPEGLLDKISSESEDGSSYRGPAIAPVVNLANYPMEITSVTSEGFFGTPDVVTKKALRSKTTK